MDSLLHNVDFLHALFDAVPAMLFLVDSDVRIYHLNASAARALSLDRAAIYRRRGGEALHCLHATDTAEGCGRSAACEDCVIRICVERAIETGSAVTRCGELTRITQSGASTLNLRIATAPFSFGGIIRVVMQVDVLSEKG